MNKALTFWHLLLIVGVFLVSNAFPKVASAADDVCVALYPCDKDGNTIPPYDTADGVCAENFRRQCASIKANLLGEQLAQCEVDAKSTEDRYKKKIRALQRKLKAKR